MSRLIPDPDLERLVAEINRETAGLDKAKLEAGQNEMGLPVADALLAADLFVVREGELLERTLRAVVKQSASDLLLLAGESWALRIDGRLVRFDSPVLDDEELASLFAPHLDERTRTSLGERGSADFSLRLPAPSEDGAADPGGGRRFRVNLHRQRGRLAAAIRVLPHHVPTLAGLNLPPTLADLIRPSRGLVLVSGPTGAGKTSTLAALVGEINRTRPVHVITIEDPIEYEHANDQAVIEQIEVGIDAPSFAEALRAALRQDPDVILVGEMRDLETIRTALSAAETGHLILSTLHTGDVAQAIHRMVDVFPSDGQEQIRHQLALSLHAVICQQLVPRADVRGRVPAVEILLATYPVRQHVRSQSLQKLHNEITLGQRHGMVSLEASLAELVRRGAIDREEALVRANRPDEMTSLLR
jgi:twitching motility protein PilT